MKRYQFASELANLAASDQTVANEIKKDPAAALAKYSQTPLQTDTWIYRLVVIALGLTILLAVGGGIYLAASGIDKTPEILIALGSAAVGALAGLLAPSPAK